MQKFVKFLKKTPVSHLVLSIVIAALLIIIFAIAIYEFYMWKFDRESPPKKKRVSSSSLPKSDSTRQHNTGSRSTESGRKKRKRSTDFDPSNMKDKSTKEIKNYDGHYWLIITIHYLYIL